MPARRVPQNLDGVPTAHWLPLVCVLLLFSACATTRNSPPPAAPVNTSAAVGTTTIVAIAPPAPTGPTTSLPQMLGLPQLFAGVGEVVHRIGSRISRSLDLTGRFPGLQPQPPLLALSDPANMSETAPPSVQAAAEVKAEEDAAAQKVMAIRYLATIGCGGCYEKVETALLEGMSDCTESVRYEAVRALECRPDSGCRYCSSSSCCSPPVRKRLEELSTCDHEPSPRINRAARLALACCNGKPLDEDQIPREGPPPVPTAAPAAGGATAGLHSVLESGGEVAVNLQSHDPVARMFAEIQLVSYRPQNAQTSAAGADRIVALVNDEAITSSQLVALVDARSKNNAVVDLRAREQLHADCLRRLIDWKLLEQISKSELNQVMPAVGVYVNDGGLSPAELQTWLERKLAVDNNVPATELMAYFAVNQQRFMLPARARWEKLTVRTYRCASTEHAIEVASYIKSRAEGKQLLPPEGLDKSMVESEVVGWQDIKQLDSTLQTVLNSLAPGQVSNAFPQGEDLCLLRLLEREPVRLMPISSVADSLVTEIVAQRREAALEHFLAQARANSRIWSSLEVAGTLPTTQ